MEDKQMIRRKMHLRIWIQGFIAASIFIVLISVMAEERVINVFIVQFITFYMTWVIIHYILFRKQFKSLKE